MLDNIRIIFVEPEYQDNIGYLARVMKNFDLKELVLVSPKTIVGEEASLRAAHAQDILQNLKIISSFEEAIKDMDFVIGTTSRIGDESTSPRLALTPSEFVEKIQKFSGKIALVFGREKQGLTNKELTLCDSVISIPASKDYPTLNIAHTAAILFYELFKGQISLPKPRIASKAEREELISAFESILKLVNYPIHKKEIAVLIFRRILSRAVLTGRETFTIRGIIRRIENSLKKGSHGAIR